MTLRLGSLFSGYGGLEIGIGRVLDTEPVWHSEFDSAPSQILDHHWPGVPNLGDVTAIDWAAAPPIDVLCGGFPCQDVSGAGLRMGLKPGTRSGLWVHFAEAVDQLRPRLVVIENVRGLLSAEAHSPLEPDAWDLGGPARADRPALRALGAVLGDLADCGYDARWLGLRAADAGAPHGRFRVFVVAAPAADSGDDGRGERRPPLDRDSGISHRDEPDGLGPAAADPDGERHGRREDARVVGPVDRRDAGEARERERARGIARDRGAEAPPDPGRIPGDPRREGGPGASPSAGTLDHPRGRGAWGAYRAAIERWEHVTGRLAPSPTDRTPRGERLSPRFVEWMMGLDPGHVTAPEIGLNRKQQLKALGNGVVPQQAALAIRTLLGAR